MLTYRAYRFPDADTADRALAAHQPVAVDVIGIAYEPVDDDVLREMQPIEPVARPGWWVNVVWSGDAPSDLYDYEVPPADAPRWWAGVPTADPPEPVLTDAEAAEIVQQHIDTVARTRGYRDGFACASYVASTVDEWAREAAAFITWRDQVWSAVYAERAPVTRSALLHFLSELGRPEW